MREEDIKKMIKNSADHVNIPEQLEPENMMRRLHELDQEDGAGTNHDSGQEETPDTIYEIRRKKNTSRYWRYGTAAAALLAFSLFTVGQGKVLPWGSLSRQTEQETGVADESSSTSEFQVEAVSDDETAYQAFSYDDVYERFQQLRKEEAEKYREYYGEENTSLLTRLFGGKSKGSYGAAAGSVEDSRTEMILETIPETAPEAGGASIYEVEFDTATGESNVSGSYSETNIQVEGVDEGDVVKTDGKYIYAASANQGTIRIIKPDGNKMIKIGEIQDTSTVNSSHRIEEFYVNGACLTVIRRAYQTDGPEQQLRGYASWGKSVTIIETYDLTNPQEPKLSGTVIQDGYYKSSRRSGDYVYVFTGYDVDADAGKKEIEKYVPQVNGTVLPADCIYLPEVIDSYQYLVISSVDMMKPDQPVQTKAVAASGEQYYVSGSNIYVAASKYDFRASQYDYTELIKFSYRDGRIDFAAHGKVNGYLNNQFSMDEYKGNLRLVSTLSRSNGKTTNSLYVLNEQLEKIGAVEDLAPDELIYSARFMGDIGYFVTFRNMDPLFSVDLSDPTKPEVLGELKITGFSEYLHPYADGLLLGIGREVNPNTTNFEGLKLSMFDTKKASDVKEVQKLVEESFEFSTAWNNHKSVLISSARNLIGFTVESYDYDKREWKVAYAVYSYDKTSGFKQELLADLDETNDYYMTRGLYLNHWLYVVENNRINAFSLNDFSHGGELTY